MRHKTQKLRYKNHESLVYIESSMSRPEITSSFFWGGRGVLLENIQTNVLAEIA